MKKMNAYLMSHGGGGAVGYDDSDSEFSIKDGQFGGDADDKIRNSKNEEEDGSEEEEGGGEDKKGPQDYDGSVDVEEQNGKSEDREEGGGEEEGEVDAAVYPKYVGSVDVPAQEEPYDDYDDDAQLLPDGSLDEKITNETPHVYDDYIVDDEFEDDPEIYNNARKTNNSTSEQPVNNGPLNPYEPLSQPVNDSNSTSNEIDDIRSKLDNMQKDLDELRLLLENLTSKNT
jgi:hypothetical protein